MNKRYERFQQLEQSKVEGLIRILTILGNSDIPFVLGGSAALYFLGNEAIPDDFDIFLDRTAHDMADELFGIQSFTYESALEMVRNSNPEGSHDYQLTSGLLIMVDGKAYDLSLNQDMFDHAIPIPHPDGHVWVMAPEDILLIKAILQRGPEVGKNDVGHIHAFLEGYRDKMRWDYLRYRIEQLDATERVSPIFDNYYEFLNTK